MRNILRAPALALAVVFLSVAVSAKDKPPKHNETSPTWPLSGVVTVAEEALNAYQTFASSTRDNTEGLPPLATADFDFKTVVDTKITGGVNLYIFTIGASHEKQDTNEVDFQYAPRPKREAELDYFYLDGKKVPKSLYDQLLETMKESAREIKEASAQPAPLGETQLDFCQLSMSISFGVTTDLSGGLKGPISFITLSATFDRSHNNVQQVKLVFKVKDPTGKTCVAPK